MDDSLRSLEESVLSAEGPVLFVGASDTGKSTLAARLAKAAVSAGRVAALLDGDVGQSEVGPPGLMDLAEARADAPVSKWTVRGQWYIGAASPYSAHAATVAGYRRLADRASERGLSPLLVDTASLINTPSGHALMTAVVDVLRPALIVAVQQGEELERWLRGVPCVRRVPVEAAARVKPSGLRAARRAARLGGYFREAPEHAIRLSEWALRGTRLCAAPPLPPAECARAASLLGCPVVHGERAAASVAFWTLGKPRHDPAKAAADLGARRAVTFDAAYWNGRSVGFIGADGFCVAMGMVERVDWPSLIATVRAPVYSVADAVAMSAGLMRHTLDGESRPPVPDGE